MRNLFVCLSVLFIVSVSGCAHRIPPNLSPQARVAWQATEVVKALDQVRDLAIAANEAKPTALLSDKSTRAIVTYHRSALVVIKDAPTGWQTIVGTGFEQTVHSLPSESQRLLSPYVDVVFEVLKGIK